MKTIKDLTISELFENSGDNDYGNWFTDEQILDAQEKAEKGLKENKDLAELLAEFSVDIIQIYQKIIERYVEEMKIKIQYEEEEL